MDPRQFVLTLIILGIPAVSLSTWLLSRPFLNAFLRSRELKAGVRMDPARLDAQDQRIAELEGEVAAMRHEMERLSSVESFYAQLGAGNPKGVPPPGAKPAGPGV